MSYAFGIFLIFLIWTLLAVGVALAVLWVFIKVFKKMYK